VVSSSGRPVRTRKASAEASQATRGEAPPASPAAAAAAAAAAEEAEEADYSPRSTMVGDEYQVDIPDLLSAKDRKKAAAPPPPGTGAKMVRTQS